MEGQLYHMLLRGQMDREVATGLYSMEIFDDVKLWRLKTQLEWVKDQIGDEEMKPMITHNFFKKFSYKGARDEKKGC